MSNISYEILCSNGYQKKFLLLYPFNFQVHIEKMAQKSTKFFELSYWFFFLTSATRRGGEGERERRYLWKSYTKLHMSLDTSECRSKFSKSKTVGKPTVRICTCLDYAIHLHKQHKPGLINHSAPRNTCLINFLIAN